MKQKIAVENWYSILSHKQDSVGSIPTSATNLGRQSIIYLNDDGLTLLISLINFIFLLCGNLRTRGYTATLSCEVTQTEAIDNTIRYQELCCH